MAVKWQYFLSSCFVLDTKLIVLCNIFYLFALFCLLFEDLFSFHFIVGIPSSPAERERKDCSPSCSYILRLVLESN